VNVCVRRFTPAVAGSRSPYEPPPSPAKLWKQARNLNSQFTAGRSCPRSARFSLRACAGIHPQQQATHTSHSSSMPNASERFLAIAHRKRYGLRTRTHSLPTLAVALGQRVLSAGGGAGQRRARRRVCKVAAFAPRQRRANRCCHAVTGKLSYAQLCIY
jgi:hypothetical protein